jgi:hypothetical protein
MLTCFQEQDIQARVRSQRHRVDRIWVSQKCAVEIAHLRVKQVAISVSGDGALAINAAIF